MIIDYISCLEGAVDLCNEFERSILRIYLKEGKSEKELIPNFVWLYPYQKYFQPVKACLELCRILKPQSLRVISAFFEAGSCLDNVRATSNIADFKMHLGPVRNGFARAKDELSAICLAFDDEEKERMNEAIHNYFEGCNYSCVAMSVSVVESRLLKLMCLANPESAQELEKKTLGQLIYEYVQNRDKYKNVVPEKHEPLVNLCNVYRTFSVHPKKQKIKPTLATSILNLTIEFLTDHDTKPEVVKAQLVANRGANEA